LILVNVCGANLNQKSNRENYFGQTGISNIPAKLLHNINADEGGRNTETNFFYFCFRKKLAKYHTMNVPKNMKYTHDHEWIRVEGNEAVIGITHYAQDQLGDIVFIEIETEGETLEKGEVFGTIEAVKTVSDMFMPVGGEILGVNEKLSSSPEVVNQDPYGDGWMIRIRITDPSELDALFSPEDYEKEIH
jgi:glycine cleavage system H protein